MTSRSRYVLREIGALVAQVVVIMLIALSVGWIAGLTVVAFRMVAG